MSQKLVQTNSIFSSFIGIERGVSAAIRILTEQGMPTLVNRNESPQNIKTGIEDMGSIQKNPENNSGEKNEPYPDEEEQRKDKNPTPPVSPRENVEDPSEKENVDPNMVPIKDIEDMLQMVRQKVSADQSILHGIPDQQKDMASAKQEAVQVISKRQMEKPQTVTTGQFDARNPDQKVGNASKPMNLSAHEIETDIITAEVRKDLVENPDFVSEMVSGKIVDLTTSPSASGTMMKAGNIGATLKELKVSLARLENKPPMPPRKSGFWFY